MQGSLAMDDLKRFVEQDAFARHVGVEVLEYGDGRATARLIVQPQHLNSAGTLHGGAIFSLADAAFSAAANSHGVLALSIDTSISYFRAVSGGTLTAEAREVARNPKLATYLIDVTDESGGLIAHFRGTVYRKSAAIGDVFVP
jgi:acyl-CoA thioesterase